MLTAQKLIDRLGPFITDRKTTKDVPRFLIPFVMLMRLDSRLEPSRTQFQDALTAGHLSRDELKSDSSEGGYDTQEARAITNEFFYNLCDRNLKNVAAVEDDCSTRLKQMVTGFSPRVRDLLIGEMGIEQKSSQLEKEQNLPGFLGELATIQKEIFHESDHSFRTLLSDLLQQLTEKTGDDASDCATPSDVVRLGVRLLVDPERLKQGGSRRRTVYDPCSGTSGFLLAAAEEVNRLLPPKSDVSIAGNDTNLEMRALGTLNAILQASRFSDLDPADAGAIGEVIDIRSDNSFLPGSRRKATAQFAVVNPPMGKSGKWASHSTNVQTEASLDNTRFAGGLPGTSDSSFLFLQQIVDALDEDGRAVLIFNGSSLFAGQVTWGEGRNEQNIRRWLLEKDYLDTIVALPPNLFFNTSISTYIWLLDKNKPQSRRKHVLLVDASGVPSAAEPNSFASQLSRNLNEKRFELESEAIDRIVDLVRNCKTVEIEAEDEDAPPFFISRKIPVTDFFYRLIRVNRPLRQLIRMNGDQLESLAGHVKWIKYSNSNPELASATMAVLHKQSTYETDDRAEFDAALNQWLKAAKVKLPKAQRTLIAECCAERSQAAKAYYVSGELVPDPDLRDEERLPWGTTTAEYLEKEIRPHLPPGDQDLVWTDELKPKSQTHPEGAEIPFSRYFYRYIPPRKLSKIQHEISDLRVQINGLLDELENDPTWQALKK